MIEQTNNKRKIRSFVRREGRMTPGQERALEQHSSRYGLAVAQGLISLEDVFSNKHPVTVEIGFGMGQALLAMAQAEPQMNFIGIEVHRPGVGKLLACLHEHQVDNVRVYQEDAQQVFLKCMPDASLQRILIYFPDPWPKKRHNKRRLIQPEFVQLLTRKLCNQGELYFATDWEDYAHHALEVFSAEPQLTNIQAQGGYLDRPDWRPLTKFELRGQKLGHGVWDLGFRRTT